MSVEPDTRWVRRSVAEGDVPEADIRYHIRTNVPSLQIYVSATALRSEEGPQTIPLDEDAGVEIAPERAVAVNGSGGLARFVSDDETAGLPSRRSESLLFESPLGAPLSQDVVVRVRWRSQRSVRRGQYTAVVRLVAMPRP